jgi:hypothetical protein
LTLTLYNRGGIFSSKNSVCSIASGISKPVEGQSTEPDAGLSEKTMRLFAGQGFRHIPLAFLSQTHDCGFVVNSPFNQSCRSCISEFVEIRGVFYNHRTLIVNLDEFGGLLVKDDHELYRFDIGQFHIFGNQMLFLGALNRHISIPPFISVGSSCLPKDIFSEHF